MQQKINLSKAVADNNYHFDDIHSPLTHKEALEEASRCLYCYNAPCITACPTHINIPDFIRKISTNNLQGSAQTILSENIFGGSCARVCPTEILCEHACVRNTHPESNPVKIGLLQRHAIDNIQGEYPFVRKSDTNKKIAVIGAGPAGISCAHKLAQLGHAIDIFEKESKIGGLNEYGIASYKLVNNYSELEINKILDIGNINIFTKKTLGDNLFLNDLLDRYHAVFIAIGLASARKLNIPGESLPNVLDATHFIHTIRQHQIQESLKGKSAIVIGGGNTAIDVAVQLKKLGAGKVTLAYRRGYQHMSATLKEQQLAQLHDVHKETWFNPIKIDQLTDKKLAVTFHIQTHEIPQETITLTADYVFKAIGQTLCTQSLFRQNQSTLSVHQRKIAVNDNYQTSIPSVFAGGDCIYKGQDLTVYAVQQGKEAAESIHSYIIGD
ncbi:NAD(P)-dependent oxidoreductase [Zooshikella sp. RANM57]|uniref:NAD(P)-dependent oxidoreductase n=1 Tax=Zooshikella sp. RANM57 TaxID=3425863 RepID=UPI003D70224B